ncbi:MAG: endonuclease, partial [Verrucomicrobiota bacterium]
WPQSRFSGDAMMKTDLHHLFAAYSRINNDRSAKAFGEIPDTDTKRWWAGTAPTPSMPRYQIDRYSESTSSLFEPREAHKGNVARSLFYFRTIYGDEQIDLEWFDLQKPTLRHWHRIDPVDREERLRSAAIRELQGNENPFVLDSSLVWRAFPKHLDRGATSK